MMASLPSDQVVTIHHSHQEAGQGAGQGAGQPVVIWLRRRDTDTAASAQEVVAHGAEVLVPELDRVRASVAASPALYTSTLTVGDAVYNHKIPPCRFR